MKLRLEVLARRWIASILAVVLLATQLATVAYACPNPGMQTPAQAQAMAGMPCEQTMTGADVADPYRPALCFKHCHGDASQQPPHVALSAGAWAPAFVLLFHLAPSAPTAADAPVWAAHRSHRERAPPAPHSIVHCCFRI
jgi:hypothetical protein